MPSNFLDHLKRVLYTSFFIYNSLVYNFISVGMSPLATFYDNWFDIITPGKKNPYFC